MEFEIVAKCPVTNARVSKMKLARMLSESHCQSYHDVYMLLCRRDNSLDDVYARGYPGRHQRTHATTG